MKKLKLNNWFEIDEQQYVMYILSGYDIAVSDEHIIWRLNGNPHREDGPAVIHSDGTQEWWLNGHLHREDGPAVIHSDGTQEWCLNGKLRMVKN